MLLITREVLTWLLSHYNAPLEEIESYGGELEQRLQNYKENYRLQATLELRSKIKELVEEDHPLLKYLVIDNETFKKLKRESSKKVWEKIANKKLISFPYHKELAKALLISEKEEFILLGILLTTGRRYSEAKIENFELDKDNPNNLLFKGQLKKKGDIDFYLIPCLIERKYVLNGLLKLEESKIDINDKGFSQRVLRLSHFIFNHKVHSLRAKYTSFILAREGLLEKDSLKEPLLRAKELLGHDLESDATFAYREFAINNNPLSEKEKKELEEKLNFIDNWQRLEPLQGRKIGTNNLDKELNALFQVEHLSLDWLDFQRLYLKLYFNKHHKQLWKQKLKEFYIKKQKELQEAIS